MIELILDNQDYIALKTNFEMIVHIPKYLEDLLKKNGKIFYAMFIFNESFLSTQLVIHIGNLRKNWLIPHI